MIDVVRLPKAELHLHIEGTLEPELIFEIAERNRVALDYPNVEALRAAYRFANLAAFLKLYYQGMSVLRYPADYYDLTSAYLRRAHAQGVRHAEIFFDPQAHASRGVTFDVVVDGVTRALDDGERALGITSRLIMCFLRDLPSSSAMQTLESALPYRERIIAVGLDSAERGHPPSEFAVVFDRARAEGFLTVAHAGEEGPAEYVWQAIDLLKVSRIDHGIRSLEDRELVARLARQQVPLTVCPLSNARLHVVSSLEKHPLRRMLQAGLMATCNSDDPAYFGGYVADNYRETAAALGLTDDEIVALARNSFNASFLDDVTKRGFLAEIDAFVAEGRQP